MHAPDTRTAWHDGAHIRVTVQCVAFSSRARMHTRSADGICKGVLGLRRDGFKKHHGVAWNARIALATIKMVKCWKASCADNSTEPLILACHSLLPAVVHSSMLC